MVDNIFHILYEKNITLSSKIATRVHSIFMLYIVCNECMNNCLNILYCWLYHMNHLSIFDFLDISTCRLCILLILQYSWTCVWMTTLKCMKIRFQGRWSLVQVVFARGVTGHLLTTTCIHFKLVIIERFDYMLKAYWFRSAKRIKYLISTGIMLKISLLPSDVTAIINLGKFSTSWWISKLRMLYITGNLCNLLMDVFRQ